MWSVPFRRNCRVTHAQALPEICVICRELEPGPRHVCVTRRDVPTALVSSGVAVRGVVGWMEDTSHQGAGRMRRTSLTRIRGTPPGSPACSPALAKPGCRGPRAAPGPPPSTIRDHGTLRTWEEPAITGGHWLTLRLQGFHSSTNSTLSSVSPNPGPVRAHASNHPVRISPHSGSHEVAEAKEPKETKGPQP